ncbi:hypothetical protein ABZ890_45910 [Streptomyces sp. NPDC046984]|uniref:hypothetical protein n=1 Tax=Streptomyces sp. NPDC046984 TaxID=3155138 RepID=UPI00340719C7
MPASFLLLAPTLVENRPIDQLPDPTAWRPTHPPGNAPARITVSPPTLLSKTNLLSAARRGCPLCAPDLPDLLADT